MQPPHAAQLMREMPLDRTVRKDRLDQEGCLRTTGELRRDAGINQIWRHGQKADAEHGAEDVDEVSLANHLSILGETLQRGHRRPRVAPRR